MTPAPFVGQRTLSVTADTYTHVLVDERELDYAALLGRAAPARPAVRDRRGDPPPVPIASGKAPVCRELRFHPGNC
jgi:hypothetical protein